MTKEVIFATGNQSKLKEIRAILGEDGYTVISMAEAGIGDEIPENGVTFAENARMKARFVSDLTGKMALADDSGLAVDALGGAPGIFSARFLGHDTSYDIKNRYLIDQLKNVKGEARSARFICAIALALPDGTDVITQAAMEGQIGYEIAGENGFGYDPVFYLPEYGCTSAQLPPEEKNRISHRGKALRATACKMRKLNEKNC